MLRHVARARPIWRRTCVSQPTIKTVNWQARSASSFSGVKILEVGPRDGLQNISKQVPTPVKVELIQRLASAGLRNIEATSFVSPKWVPQLADGAEVMAQIWPLTFERGIRTPVLAPNVKGLENAIKAGATEVCVFASATEAFSKKNQNCTVEEALDASEKVAKQALRHNAAVRGVVSCIFSDPYSGPTDPAQVLKVVKRFLDMGCHEVGLGDTLGVGTPKDTQTLLELLLKGIPAEKLAGHFHDTYGQAVANVMRAYDMGIRSFDSSVAGLGGCPYAKGAKGNLATEDIVYTFDKSGIDTGIDLQKLSETGDWISQQLGLPNSSRAGAALVAKAKSAAPAAEKPAESPPKRRTWKEIENTGEYSVSRAGNAVKITLTRPQKGNSMTRTMLEGLTNLYKSLAKDKTVFHIMLTSEGKFFCTGMDLSGGTDRTSKPDAESSYYGKVMDLFNSIDQSPQTTIALIDGPCFGGGVGLGFACDVRLVSPKAKWILTEIKLGLSPAIISKYMVREWGIPFFREAMLSGREVSPEELQRIGAVHGMSLESNPIDVMAEGYLDKLERCAPQSAAACKELVRLAWTNPDGQKQNSFIERTFETMMAPGSEGEFGIKQFQNKIKQIDWGAFWASGRAKL